MFILICVVNIAATIANQILYAGVSPAGFGGAGFTGCGI